MKGFYIDGDEVRITRTDLTSLKLEVYNGNTYCQLEPIRLFPSSGITKYISLVDENGSEVAIIRDIEKLMPESKKAVEECLDEYYIVPKIRRILARKEKYGNITWTVETNRGIHSFDIVNTPTDIKALYDGRILIKDSNDNRYEIENVKKLDKSSLNLLKYDM